ncbi:MAG: S41 family peptidase [Gammaproteobacteria bacterium]|nr:S41 family peptidase [Gammaproteobacteria bacterium]
MKILLNSFFILSFIAGLTGPAYAEQTKSKSEGIPLEHLRNFSDIFARIKSDYVEEADDKTLLENAIRGMLSGLDPHSTYLDPEEYKELKIGTTGQFGGLGIQVGMEDGFVKVISPIDDTPAFRAGIKAGDLIIRLDEKPVKGMTLNDAVNLMRGKPGSEITLTIIRGDSNNPLTFKIKRDIIKVKSVKSRMLEKDYGYVRISTFQSRTASHLKEAIESLSKENKNSLKGLILDLRNNPGGVLNAAADVSDLFLNDGLIVYTKGRVQNSYFEFKAKSGDLLKDAPLVVLINGGSASASEIVAGALQDQKRAVIMGSKSFGKGSVQTIQELRNGGAVKFTTARYFTPSGRSIQADGIEPDISLDHYKLSASEDNNLNRIKEADLAGHLTNPNGKEENQEIVTDKANNQSSPPEDYQINEALNLLKGLSIFRDR